MINLAPLFDKQDMLDAHIAAEHPPQEGEDRLGKLILALNVELAELAQETRCFKYWSVDQTMRRGKALGEFVDVLHFILSIGNHTGHANAWIATAHQNHISQYIRKDEVMQFNALFGHVSRFGILNDDYGYCAMVYTFLILGEMLGFTDKEIVEAYEAKNRENHARQERGY